MDLQATTACQFTRGIHALLAAPKAASVVLRLFTAGKTL